MRIILVINKYCNIKMNILYAFLYLLNISQDSGMNAPEGSSTASTVVMPHRVILTRLR